ncbi:hypothetical protein JY651_20355 [Pyxidicoccus parkwayensis]|uniref:Aminoglycoside phosphotransferase domain-containing protein n=1 Tax=Pyxidicoccus parkwayensis TaxID=2813578 RepID=A0ABX7P9J6_9BACT|nr:hypothetical protein [Pyxidicoccus parkwaysis]QSQ27119.1 hypothetical protein JY651_20355 [Pyxidicoccus parkwaysis]
MPPGVSFTTDDSKDWQLPVASPGLILDVPAKGHWLRRPSLHLEAAPRYRLRLVGEGQSRLWVRIDSYWDRCILVRGPVPTRGVLPALSAPEVRAVDEAPGTPEWWEAWTWQLGRMLVEAPASVLHTGRWCLRSMRTISADKAPRHAVSPMEWAFGQLPVAPHSLEAVLRFQTAWEEDWWAERPEEKPGAVLPLREPSDAEHGRIKSWRKRARDGTLPPAVLLHVDILSKWLVLDGHDRIQAALLEGVEPPLLGLWPFVETRRPASRVREEGALLSAELQLRSGATPEVIDRVNRMLVRNFDWPERGSVSRAWPIPGGFEAWRAELLAWRGQNPVTLDERDWDWLVSPQA